MILQCVGLSALQRIDQKIHSTKILSLFSWSLKWLPEQPETMQYSGQYKLSDTRRS